MLTGVTGLKATQMHCGRGESSHNTLHTHVNLSKDKFNAYKTHQLLFGLLARSRTG